MKLGNLARTVMSAGAISLLASTTDGQTIESKLKHAEVKAVDVKTQISDLYEKIKKLEFDFEQNIEKSDGVSTYKEIFPKNRN